MITSPEELAALNLFPDQPNLLYGGRDISGLTQDAQPGGDWEVQNSFQGYNKDREFYLVKNKVTGQSAVFRICDAYPDSGYARFCVLHEVSTDGSAEALYLRWKDCRL